MVLYISLYIITLIFYILTFNIEHTLHLRHIKNIYRHTVENEIPVDTVIGEDKGINDNKWPSSIFIVTIIVMF